MNFFISCEIDGRSDNTIGEKFRRARKLVEDKIKDFVKEQNYGSEIINLSIIPVIMNFNNNMDSQVWFKERKLFKRKSSTADYRLKIDYDKFLGGTDEHRINLLLKNIIDSIRDLGEKAKKDFNSKKLESDILNLFNKKYEDFL